ncbi:hypothetical protein GCM10020000_86450 [Streptomyces olivoverticillatus]
MSSPEPSGIDLARVALKAAREAAKKKGASARRTRPQPRRRSPRADGRDPVGLGAALESLVAARAWEMPVEGASVLDQWARIAGPGLAAHVTAVHFDPDSGRLDLLPDFSELLKGLLNVDDAAGDPLESRDSNKDRRRLPLIALVNL